MAGKPTISLCMIVKNEEKYLPQCLQSALGKVDEIIVVDTGSTDKTVEIARSFGAQVYFFQWVDDFSAARNESVRYATGDWVFWMDADERLECGGDVDCLRKAASVPGIDAYLVPIRSHKLGANSGFHYALRFSRRFPGLCFEGEVHESLSPFLQSVGANFVPAAFFLDHWGYAIDAEAMGQKVLRNTSLLHKSLERNPKSAFVLYYYAMSLLVTGQEEEVLEVFSNALEGENLTANLQALILNGMSVVHYGRKEYDRAVETARKSLLVIPNQNTARLLIGIAHYNERRYEEALPYLFLTYQFLRLPPDRRRTGISKEELYDEIDIVGALATCYAHVGQYAQAICFFRRYLEKKEGSAETYRLLGLCHLNCEDYSSAAVHLTKAIGLGADAGALAFPVAYALFETSRLQESMHYFLAAAAKGSLSTEETALLQELVSECFSAGRELDVLRFLQRVAAMVPGHTLVLDALGVACIKTGDTAGALDAYRMLHALVPEDAEVCRRLAGLLCRMGDEDGAVALLQARR